MPVPLPAKLIGEEVTLHLLSVGGVGAKVHGVLKRRRVLGYVSYAVEVTLNGNTISSGWFPLSHLELVKTNVDGHQLWVK